MMDSAMKNDARIVKSTAAGSDRTKSPGPSGRKSSGTKASSSVTVQPSTASQIWSVAAMAASRRGMPWRTWRAMFSTTTMESSTRRPSATTNPAMDSWFSEKPKR